MPTRQIVQRLTSAINVLTLGAAALPLLLGIDGGPHDALRAGLPVIAANAAIILHLALPKVAHRVSSSHPWATWLEDVAVGVPAARHTLAPAQLAPIRCRGLLAVRHRSA